MFKKLGAGTAIAVVGLALTAPPAALAERRDCHEHHFRHEHFHHYHGPRYGGVYLGPYHGPYAYGYYHQWGIWPLALG